MFDPSTSSATPEDEIDLAIVEESNHTSEPPSSYLYNQSIKKPNILPYTKSNALITDRLYWTIFYIEWLAISFWLGGSVLPFVVHFPGVLAVLGIYEVVVCFCGGILLLTGGTKTAIYSHNKRVVRFSLLQAVFATLPMLTILFIFKTDNPVSQRLTITQRFTSVIYALDISSPSYIIPSIIMLGLIVLLLFYLSSPAKMRSIFFPMSQPHCVIKFSGMIKWLVLSSWLSSFILWLFSVWMLSESYNFITGSVWVLKTFETDEFLFLQTYANLGIICLGILILTELFYFRATSKMQRPNLFLFLLWPCSLYGLFIGINIIVKYFAGLTITCLTTPEASSFSCDDPYYKTIASALILLLSTLLLSFFFLWHFASANLKLSSRQSNHQHSAL